VTSVAQRRSIEIHDSVLTQISFLQNEAQFHFSAYMHQSEGIPGRDPGSGWVQEAILHIQDAQIKGSFSELPVTLSDGQFWLGHNNLMNLIPIPLRRCKGDFKLRLEAWKQVKEVVIVTGSEVELELIGQPKYVEEFRP